MFTEHVNEPTAFAQTIEAFAVLIWIAVILFAVAAAVWMFRDAENRGKNGFAAAVLALMSVYYHVPATIIVVCAWILIRPDRIHRSALLAETPLPDELPSDIVSAPTSDEFLGGLEETP